MKRAERRAAARQAQVLVVDDEPDIRELLELTLTKMGLGGAGAVALAVLVGLTLVPALLGAFGDRVLSRANRRAAKVPASQTQPESVDAAGSAAPAKPARLGERWARFGDDRVVGPLALGHANGVNRREVNDVETHLRDRGQALGGSREITGGPLGGRGVVGCALRPRKEFIPGAPAGCFALHQQDVEALSFQGDRERAPGDPRKMGTPARRRWPDRHRARPDGDARERGPSRYFREA